MSRNDFNDSRSSRVPKTRSSVPQPHPPKQTSLVKTVGIKTLRSAIRGLENLVEALEAEPSRSPNSGAPQRRSRWQTVLFQVRLALPSSKGSRLPKKLKLNDRTLTGIMVGIVVASLWFIFPVFSSKPPTEVASNPPQPPTEIASEPVETAPIPPVPTPSPESFPADLSSDSSEILVATEPEAITPDVSKTPVPGLAPKADSVLTSEPPSESSELKPEPSPVAVEPEPPEPQPEPIEPTPEQSLIASIQAQLTEISNRYTTALVQSVQPDFRRSRLTVRVSDSWYQLSPQQQNELGDQWWARSQELDFSQSYVTDASGTVVARNPVIGSSMVILKRSPSLPKAV